MKDFDFGYFGTGDEGYAQYMTAFERNCACRSIWILLISFGMWYRKKRWMPELKRIINFLLQRRSIRNC